MATTNEKLSLDDVARAVVGAFPTLDPLEQRLSLDLYRLLAGGEPVLRAELARRLEVPLETVDRILDGWPGVFADEQRRVVGYWGLALPAAYKSPHKFTTAGRTLSAWCAWDTLFLPQLLGETAEVESTAPAPGGTVRLTVAPERVERVEPAGARMSFVLPEATRAREDVLTSFCHYIYFFPAQEAGESWVAQHQGTFLLSIDEAHELARRKNAAQYKDVLR
jgi:alkylmercury lyase